MNKINLIIKSIINGNTNDFEIIVNKFKHKGMSIAMNILKNKSDAEEVLQEAFVKTFKSLHLFEQRSEFGTWFYRIVFNTALTHLKQNKQNYTPNRCYDDEESENWLDSVPSNEDSAIMIFTLTERKKSVHHAIQQLPDKIKIIVSMFYLQEFSIIEIKKITGLSEGTIKTTLFRGRSLLQHILKNKENVTP